MFYSLVLFGIPNKSSVILSVTSAENPLDSSEYWVPQVQPKNLRVEFLLQGFSKHSVLILCSKNMLL
jgi:hypothetical protein